MIKIFDSFSKLINHYKVLGFQGLLLLLNRYFKKNSIIEVNLTGYRHPLFIRNNTSDITVFYQIFLSRSYNIIYGIEPKKVIIDCGANVGLSTVFFKNRFPEAKIISIEPEKSNFEILQKNTEKYSDIHCIKSGIWNNTTNLIFKNVQHGSWGFVVEEVDYSNETTIPAISINDIMKKFSISKIDILKIDIEGSEKELFESNYEAWLPNTKIVIIELHDGLKNGASKSFFNAISKYNFHIMINDENLIFYNMETF
jgi:FkbM family methyltransferase